MNRIEEKIDKCALNQASCNFPNCDDVLEGIEVESSSDSLHSEPECMPTELKEFFSGPALQSVDLEWRAKITMEAAQTYCEQKKCPECNRQIEAEAFAEEFIEAYTAQVDMYAGQIKHNVLKGLLNGAQRKFVSMIYNIAKTLRGPVRDYIATHPMQMNEEKGLESYRIEVENGEVEVYHTECFQKSES